ncbi:histidine phosphatase family protein [Ketobacter sp.]|uniref:histidine phosphatase family protein n=1 Tax=Ketobacter sp. TaxID=2083498 RepID=UPI0025BE48C6|nr:histidine phosphatase family protein [Ketobacter sp.]
MMFGSPTEQRKITLDLIRHGEPEGGVRYRGSIDDPLSAAGWQHMHHATDQAMASGTRWDAIISSPMQRCQAFATTLAHSLDLPLTVEPDLRELCFGELEGLTPTQAWAQHPELLQRLWEDPTQHTPPGGELFTDFSARVASCLDHRILASPPGEHLLLVVHGGVIRSTLSHFIHLTPQDSFRVDVPYAGLTRFKIYLEDNGHYNAALSFINRFTGTP